MTIRMDADRQSVRAAHLYTVRNQVDSVMVTTINVHKFFDLEWMKNSQPMHQK